MMPNPLAHELRGKRLKHNAHRDPARSFENTETRIEKFSDGKIRWPPETRPGSPRLGDAGERKRSQLLAIEIEPEQIPLVIDTTEMIRPNAARFGARAAQF